MPPSRLAFAFSATPGGDADDLRKEICHADSTLPTPDLVCILAPSNNLTSSLTVEHAASAFQRLLHTAVSKWSKVYTYIYIYNQPLKSPTKYMSV